LQEVKMTTSTTNTDTRAAQRRARIEAIVSAGTVRDALGLFTRYSRLPTGQHQVVYRGAIFVGSTLQETIDCASQGDLGQ
jgi:hypothetical protein